MPGRQAEQTEILNSGNLFSVSDEFITLERRVKDQVSSSNG